MLQLAVYEYFWFTEQGGQVYVLRLLGGYFDPISKYECDVNAQTNQRAE